MMNRLQILVSNSTCAATTWLRADTKQFYNTSATAEGNVTILAMTRRMFHVGPYTATPFSAQLELICPWYQRK